MVPQRLLYSLVIYLLLIVIIVVSKPKELFFKSGMPIPFGVGQNKTIFSLGVITVALAILSFYLVTIIDMIFSK